MNWTWMRQLNIGFGTARYVDHTDAGLGTKGVAT